MNLPGTDQSNGVHEDIEDNKDTEATEDTEATDDAEATEDIEAAEDIEAIKNAKREAEAANEAKNAFLANLSHELRTPMNAIIGLSELMIAEGGLRPDVQENLKKIYKASTAMLSVVNDILDITKIDAGRYQLMPEEYDTPSFINDVSTLYALHVGGRPIEFHVDVDPSLPCRLIGDDMRVKQVCGNYLSNAFKYMQSGHVTWRVSCEKEGGKLWLVISVEDTGCGIRPDDMPKLFCDYSQIDRCANSNDKGTGLGLSLTKKIVALMGGEVSAKSEFGKGSTFMARIPQLSVTDTPIGEAVAARLRSFEFMDEMLMRNVKLARAKLPHARVLVVDDVPANLDVARGMMKPYGMKVDCVASGQAAVEAIRRGEPRYSAVFMDYMMPGMDGIEAARIIREEIGTDYAREVPIIALTANAVAGSEEIFLAHGFQAFLTKPIDVLLMDREIRRWVRGRLADPGDLPAVPDAKLLGAPGAWSVDGLDFARGFARFSCDENAYLNVLGSFSKHTRKLLGQARAASRSRLVNYAIIVHGIKGSSYGICADSIGAKAEALELAAKEGDYEFVAAHNEPFVAEAERLLDGIDALLKSVSSQKPKPHREEPDPKTLERLRVACESYDMDGVDEAIEKLDCFDYAKDGELVRWLRERVDNMDLLEIIGRLAGRMASLA